MRWLQRIRPRRLSFPAGLYLRGKRLSIVQMGKHGDGFSVQRYASHELVKGGVTFSNQSNELSELVGRLKDEGGFRSTELVSAVPEGLVKVSPVSYPNSNEADAALIWSVMRERIDGDLNDMILDYIPVPHLSSATKKLALVAAVQKSDVYDYLNVLKQAGFKPRRLEIAPLALARMMPRETGASGTSLIISVGEDETSMALVGDGHLLNYQKTEFGSSAFLRALERSLDTDTAETLRLLGDIGFDRERWSGAIDCSNELTLCERMVSVATPFLDDLLKIGNRAFQYVESRGFNGVRTHIAIMGELARWPGILELLRSRIDTPVMDLCHYASNSVDPNGVLQNAALPWNTSGVVAAGLSLSEAMSSATL